MPTYHAYIKGLNYRGNEVKNFVLESTYPRPVQLERDHENEYDENAIQVFLDGTMIGFIAKEIAAWLGPRMDAGEPFLAEAQSPEEHGRATWLPVHIIPAEPTPIMNGD